MNLFQKQFNEVQELLQLNDFQQVIKRIIDFTLDTEAIQFYKQTTAFLNWFDHNSNSVEVKDKLNHLLQDLYKVLLEKKYSHTKPLFPLKIYKRITIQILI